ncbi:GNAT family N-acetyltransferase [Paraburkholderia sp. J10-1]|uniref:GNAT family N-acetyltransferase n=1 Tax=Paraburkholderia sp. J10-1 TaxID=2805430 RepID=UPI002AB7A729|nr:GNAT family N-acetyltransferase [Paraburkholderia sp. J10-1]
MSSKVEIVVVDSLSDVTADAWNALSGGNPFVQHAYLSAMHDSKCAAKKTGWQPTYLLMRRGGALAGAMPLYLKSHSRGEYVFDHAWADAFERHGIQYYPKLLSAVPFTPVTGPRLLASSHADRVLLARGAIQFARQLDVSSMHLLFASADDVEALTEAGYMLREGVQFHWENAEYENFDAFLATMSHDKRKKMKQDSRRVADAGVTFRWLRGQEIGSAELDFFYECYERTYREHWNPPYLSRAFFDQVHRTMPDALMLVIGEVDGEPLSVALNVVEGGTMYGRYWGTREFISGLHFETCYTQGIRYCIAEGLESFEGGAQGVHKMSRGLMPTPTWSAHWVADDRFAAAIADFLDQETEAMGEHIEELEGHTPFKLKR